MQKTKTTIVFLILLSVAACKKSNNSNTAPAKFTGCRIFQITDIQSDTSFKTFYTFTYNNDGTVATITYKSAPGSDVMTKYLKYNAGSIIVSLMSNGYPYSKDSLQLDAQGRIVRADHWGDNEASYPNVVFEQYLYDSVGNMITCIAHHYTTLSTTTYQWKNGDVVWNTAGTDFYSYVYGSELYNTGNIKALLSDFENYGHAIFTPVHFSAMAILDNADTFVYNYLLDSGGRITQLKVTEPGNYTTTKLVAYECE